jgi:hypothetical protein
MRTRFDANVRGTSPPVTSLPTNRVWRQHKKHTQQSFLASKRYFPRFGLVLDSSPDLGLPLFVSSSDQFLNQQRDFKLQFSKE